MALRDLLNDPTFGGAGGGDDDDPPDADLWDREFQRLSARGFDDDRAAEGATNIVEKRRLSRGRAARERRNRTVSLPVGESRIEGVAGRETPAPSTVREGISPKIERAARDTREATETERRRLLSTPFTGPQRGGETRTFGESFDAERAAARPDNAEVFTPSDRKAREARATETKAAEERRTARGHYSLDELEHGATRAAQLEALAREQGDHLLASQYKLDAENLRKAKLALEAGDTPRAIALSTFLGALNPKNAGLPLDLGEEGEVRDVARAREVLEGALDTEGMAARGVTGHDVGKPLADTRETLGLRKPTREVVEKDILSPLAGAIAASAVGGYGANAAISKARLLAVEAGDAGANVALGRIRSAINPVEGAGMKTRLLRGATEGQVPFVLSEASIAREQGRDPVTAGAETAAMNVPFGIASEFALGAAGAAGRAGKRAYTALREEARVRDMDLNPEKYGYSGASVVTEGDVAAANTPEKKQPFYDRLAALLDAKKEDTPLRTAIRPEDVTVGEKAATERSQADRLPSRYEAALRRLGIEKTDAEVHPEPIGIEMTDRDEAVRDFASEGEQPDREAGNRYTRVASAFGDALKRNRGAASMAAVAGTSAAGQRAGLSDDQVHTLLGLELGGLALAGLMHLRNKGVRGPEIPLPKWVRQVGERVGDKVGYPIGLGATAQQELDAYLAEVRAQAPVLRWNAMSPAERRTMLKAAGLHDVTAEEQSRRSMGTPKGVQAGVRDAVWPLLVSDTEKQSRQALRRYLPPAALAGAAAVSDDDDEKGGLALAAAAFAVPERIRTPLLEHLKARIDEGHTSYRGMQGVQAWADQLTHDGVLKPDDREVFTRALYRYLRDEQETSRPQDVMSAGKLHTLIAQVGPPREPGRSFFRSRLRDAVVALPKAWDGARPVADWLGKLTGSEAPKYSKQELTLIVDALKARQKETPKLKLTREEVLDAIDESLPEVERVALHSPLPAREEGDLHPDYADLTPEDMDELDIGQVESRFESGEIGHREIDRLRSNVRRRIEDLEEEHNNRAGNNEELEGRVTEAEEALNDLASRHNVGQHSIRRALDRVRERVHEGEGLWDAADAGMGHMDDLSPDYDPKELLEENGYSIKERPGDWVFRFDPAQQEFAQDMGAPEGDEEIGRVPATYDVLDTDATYRGNINAHGGLEGPVYRTHEHTYESALAAFREKHGDIPVTVEKEDPAWVLLDSEGEEKGRADTEDGLRDDFYNEIANNDLDMSLRDEAYSDVRDKLHDFAEAYNRLYEEGGSEDVDPPEQLDALQDYKRRLWDLKQQDERPRPQQIDAEVDERANAALPPEERRLPPTMAKGSPQYESYQRIGGGTEYRELLNVIANQPAGASYTAGHYGELGHANVAGHIRVEVQPYFAVPGVSDAQVVHAPGEPDEVRHIKDHLNQKRREHAAELAKMGEIVRKFEALPAAERERGSLSPEAHDLLLTYRDVAQHAADLAAAAAKHEDDLAAKSGSARKAERTLVLIENQSDWAQGAGARGVTTPVDQEAVRVASEALDKAQREYNESDAALDKLRLERDDRDSRFSNAFYYAGAADGNTVFSRYQDFYQKRAAESRDNPDTWGRLPLVDPYAEAFRSGHRLSGRADATLEWLKANAPEAYEAALAMREFLDTTWAEASERYERASNAVDDARRVLEEARGSDGYERVPPTPFITGGTEKLASGRFDAEGAAAYALGTARGLMEAAEGNFERFAWSDAANRNHHASLGLTAAQAIYNNMMPAQVKRLLASVGFKDAKIEHIYIRGAGHWSVKMTPEMRKAIRTMGLPLLSLMALTITPDTASAATPDAGPTEGASDRAKTAAEIAGGVAGAVLLGSAFRNGLAATLKDVASRGVATNPLVLAALGAAIAQVPDDEFQQYGYGTMALAAMKGIGSKRLAKAGGALGKAIIEAARSTGATGVVRAFNPDALLSPEVRRAIRTYEETVAKGKALAREQGGKLAKAGGKVNRAVTDVMRGEAWEGNLSPTDTKVALALAIDLSNKMAELGRAKVAHDVISPEQFAASGGDQYLPRMYAEHEAERANPAVERAGVGGGRKTRIQKYYSRQDIPENVRRDDLGEIRESSYLASYGLERGWADVGAATLFETLSATPDVLHPEWSAARADLDAATQLLQQPNLTPADQALAEQMRDGARQKIAEVTRKFSTRQGDYVALPESEGLGKLAGAVVQRDVANSINGLPDVPGITALFSWWKQSKTVFNPGTHLANVASNFVALHMAGLPMTQQVGWLGKAARDLKAYGPVTRDLTEHGILNTVPMDTRAEGKTRGRFGPTYADLLALRDETTPATAAVLEERGIKTTGEKLAERGHAGTGKLLDRLSAITKSADEVVGVRKFGDTAHTAYTNEDNIFRVVAYMWRRSEGDSPAQARAFALKELGDYRTRSPAMHLARNTFFPFLIYPAKMVPRFAAHIVDHPERWIVASATLLALNEYGEQQSGYDFGRGDIPEQSRTLGFGPLFPELVQLPMGRGRTGGVPALDFMRWTPGQAVTQGAPEHSPAARIGLPGIMQPSGPLADVGTAVATGRDPFTDEPITHDRGARAAFDYARYFGKEFLPTAATLHLPRLVEDVRKANAEKVNTDVFGLAGARPRFYQPGSGRREAERNFRDEKTSIMDELERGVRDSENPTYTRERVDDAKKRLVRAVRRYKANATALP